VPHAPQLLSSAWVFTQTLPQAFCPDGQSSTHWPFLQVVIPTQVIPQAPQLLLSVIVLTHEPPQSTVPVAHTHAPPTQVRPLPQALPHDSQWLLFEAVLTQAPLHSVRWAMQRHCPLEHVRPAGHATPPAPQLFGSVPRLTQNPPHETAGGKQLIGGRRHSPSTHRSSRPQQLLPQTNCAAAQQVPPKQLSYPWQALLQAPQWFGSVEVLTQNPSQGTAGGKQKTCGRVQAPFRHRSPNWQHAERQTSPGLQHVPPRQTSLLWQALPQAP
jgi:hypothetical protein